MKFFNYRIIIEKVWSSNVYLPKASIIKSKLGDSFYSALPTNNCENATYRLKLSFVKKNKIRK